MMREPLLERNPELGPPTLALLVGIANAIEREAAERYATLARIMDCRGEPQIAAAFRTMLDEERAHVDAVERWAATLGEPVPEVGAFRWRLPPELSKPWDEAAVSALLTPYRAFAAAVENEQRAFALYSYLAAAAEDPRVRAQAEMLAAEELRHAAVMRRWRREAWHRERRDLHPQLPSITSRAALEALLAQRESEIAGRLRAVTAKLRAMGDTQTAAVTEEAARDPSHPPLPQTASASAIPQSDNPVRLLMAAQAPLEALAETLESILARLPEDIVPVAERALANVIARIAKISLQAERRLQEAIARPASDR